MRWQSPTTDLRQAHLRAFLAERSDHWHLAVQHYLYCLEKAGEAGDRRATRFFAAKLSVAYSHMKMPHKADHYRRLS